MTVYYTVECLGDAESDSKALDLQLDVIPNLNDAPPRELELCFRRIYVYTNALEEIFPTDIRTRNKYTKKVCGIAKVGLTTDPPLHEKALALLDDEKKQLLRTIGSKRKLDYVVRLGCVVLIFMAVALVSAYFFQLMHKAVFFNFALLVAAAVGSLWVSAAVRRLELSFDDLVADNRHPSEPWVRTLALIGVAILLGLFVMVSGLKMDGLDLSGFATNSAMALLLGGVAGLGERWIPQALTERLAGKFR